MTTNRIHIVLILTATSIAHAGASGDARDGSPGIGPGMNGVGGTVLTVGTWDLDSDGPASPLLVVGGIFEGAGDTDAVSVATWDGRTWADLGGGVLGVVNCIESYRGELYVGGDFLAAAGGQALEYIARWNGDQWVALPPGPMAPVLDMAVHEDRLYVASWFNMGSGPALTVAAWNGTQWSPVGAGGELVETLEVWHSMLVGGGQFDFADSFEEAVGFWDGTAWHELAPGPSVPLGKLAAVRDELYALLGQSGVGRIARLAGSDWEIEFVNDAPLSSLTEYEGQLAASHGSTVTQFNGAGWFQIGRATGVPPVGVQVVGVYQGELILGGRFGAVDDAPAMSIASWNRMRWQPLQNVCDGDVNCDGQIDFDDIERFMQALEYPTGQFWPHQCRWAAADLTHDGVLTDEDIDAFVARVGMPCE